MQQLSADPAAGLTTGEAARVLGVSADRVRQLARAGRLPYLRTSLGRLFAAADVERLACDLQGRRAGVTP